MIQVCALRPLCMLVVIAQSTVIVNSVICVQAYVTERPVGVAIYTTDYRALRIPRGDEALPNLTPKSNR